MPEGLHISKLQEHLIKGVSPIMACVGSFSDFDRVERTAIEESFSEQLDGIHNVNFGDVPANLEGKNFLNSGRGTYVMSTIDNFNKFSQGFADCTSLIVAGLDKKTGKNISFLSHQDPIRFLFGKKEDFVKHLKQRLDEIKDRCRDGTIDAVVIGGNYLELVDEEYNSLKKKYLDSIKLLSLETKQVLGFEPSVINGPKISRGPDNIYYDNENRRLYFMRQKMNKDTGSFVQSDIEEEKKKWE
jgi:hypothetical protein